MPHCKCCKPLAFPGGAVPPFKSDPSSESGSSTGSASGDSDDGKYEWDKYECYHYTDSDFAKKLLSERQMCETAGFGLVYTGGDDKFAKGCGSCHCCQPKKNPVDTTRFGTRFQCHHWTDDEKELISGGTPESWVCQTGGFGNVYTGGSDRLAPGCGGCSCCTPEKQYEGSFECHQWTDDEKSLIDKIAIARDTFDAEQAVCLSAGFSYVYRGHKDGLPFPNPEGCDAGCHCCRPTTPPKERYEAYQYSDVDRAQGLSEMEMCLTSGTGFVYSNRDDGYDLYGNDAVAPGCGRFNCCEPKPKVPALFECHQWTYEEKRLIDQGKEEAFVCRDKSGARGIYTDMDASLAPGCGRCACCTPAASLSSRSSSD